jgi:alginate O-acetyltransferase complex protein AlgI
MLFNSGTFLLFFAGFLLSFYLARRSLNGRNRLILIASYVFYGWWDWRFLALLAGSSLFDYAVATGLGRIESTTQRKILLSFSVVANLALLGTFKYFNFFAESMAALGRKLGLDFNIGTVRLILPVGISFYTFQSLSYTIDVYRHEIQPARKLIHFLAFVSFFPQLVAGPIERAKHLLPQFGRTLIVTGPMVAEGFWLCLWGMFKKVVIADNLAPLVEMIFGNAKPGAAGVIFGTVAFSFQIYGDFSGYSDIARGLARIIGFDIMFNFNLPYSAANVREFWQRWHISLSTWLRDYLYIPLGGNRGGVLRTCRNLFVTMLLGGLWHGAAWNYVLWGAWHGGGLVAYRFWSRKEARQPSGSYWVGWISTMLFIGYGWLLFRAGSLERIVFLTQSLLDFTVPPWIISYLITLCVFVAPLILMELWQKRNGDLLVVLSKPLWVQTLLQGALLVAIVLFWEKDKVPFIYFQF